MDADAHQPLGIAPSICRSPVTYAKVAFDKLCTTKTPIAAADLLNHRVLPFYREHQVSLLDGPRH